MIPQPQAFEVEGGTWAAKAQASGRNSGAAQLNKVFSAQLPVLIYNTQKKKERKKKSFSHKWSELEHSLPRVSFCLL